MGLNFDKIKRILYELNPLAISYRTNKTIEDCKKIWEEHKKDTEKFVDDYLREDKRRRIAMTYLLSKSMAGKIEDLNEENYPQYVKEAFEFADNYLEKEKNNLTN